MDITTTLGFGMTFSNRGKAIALISSFMVSFILRSTPLVLAIHQGAVWNILYSIPLWIGIDLLLIAIFAFWGYIGVLLSCVLSSFFHPLNLIQPLTLAGFEGILILFQLAAFWSYWFDHQTDALVGDYALSVLFPGIFATLSIIVLSLISGNTLSIGGIAELLIIMGQSSLAIFLTGYPARYVLNQRRQNPRGWIPEWFILLFTEGNSQCYPARAPLTFPAGQIYQIDPHHSAEYPTRHQHGQNNSGIVTISANGEIICPNCGTSNWSNRNRCRRCRTPL